MSEILETSGIFGGRVWSFLPALREVSQRSENSHELCSRLCGQHCGELDRQPCADRATGLGAWFSPGVLSEPRATLRSSRRIRRAGRKKHKSPQIARADIFLSTSAQDSLVHTSIRNFDRSTSVPYPLRPAVVASYRLSKPSTSSVD